ncbi:uncharacterized protein LOC116194002 [Punica granatum]|uniref:Uncharacterized protein LOC116194002 n=1 Tax=Punica granatum TaxID=22663 RepID=A0A6P8C819_PUNGR|nr:uncharacterized protein LOC116194002 [Punica granatum]
MAYVQQVVTSHLPAQVNYACHEHELHLETSHELYANDKTGTFLCYVCAGYCDYVYYCCRKTSCDLIMHAKCALNLPLTINHECHQHPLGLAPRYSASLRVYADDDYWCDVCEKQRDPRFWIFYCAESEYPAHFQFPLENVDYDYVIVSLPDS